MIRLANIVLNVRYLFYLVIFSLTVVMLLLMCKILQMTYKLLLTTFDTEYKKLIHQALEITDVSLVIVLMATLISYLLFRFIITQRHL
jgi:uncharacterized membrane protein YqhA